ncbi:MAG: CPBP family intramembrane metalloprotease [Deltaproteobacteria bacterium]|nr:MAG: CPBP family intramembrane metalloprotease [Deltaproteobacteria bacterium]TMB29269.1 MAG: CPBP family intramembrane metalloprotease [Deltaproteobacteria bacterium]
METEPDLSAVSSFMGVLDDDAGDRTNGALPLSSAPPPVREPAPRLWTVLLSVPLVFAAVGIVNLILIGVAVVATGEKPDMTTIQASVERALTPPIVILSYALTSLTMLIFSVAAAALSQAGLPARLRLRAAGIPASALALFIVGFVALSGSSGALFSLLGVSDQGSLGQLQRILANASPAMLAVSTLVIGLGAGLAEELYFRGYLQTRLSKRWGRWPAILLTAVLFALIHFDRLQSPFAFVAGLAFGWMTERTGSLRPAIAAHVTNNAVSVLATGLLPSFPARSVQAALLGLCLTTAAVCYAALRRRLPPDHDSGVKNKGG